MTSSLFSLLTGSFIGFPLLSLKSLTLNIIVSLHLVIGFLLISCYLSLSHTPPSSCKLYHIYLWFSLNKLIHSTVSLSQINTFTLGCILFTSTYISCKNLKISRSKIELLIFYFVSCSFLSPSSLNGNYILTSSEQKTWSHP